MPGHMIVHRDQPLHGSAGLQDPALAVTPANRVAAPDCDELAVLCWCGKRSVWVPQAEAGFSTLSCGRRSCVEPRTGEQVVGELVPHGKKGSR